MAPWQVWIAWIFGGFILSVCVGLITGPVLKKMSARYPHVYR